MITGFYNQSMYRVIPNLKVPSCFLSLDKYFDTKFGHVRDFIDNPLVLHTKNICIRISNIDFYAYLIQEELDSKRNFFKSVILIGSLMVGYFSSCKSFIDSISITLNDLFVLNLLPKEKDFSKTKFWNAFGSKNIECKRKYFTYKNIFDDIIIWRDASIHRITPLVVLHSPTPPEKTPRELQSIKMYPDPNQFGILTIDKNKKWIEVLDKHKEWYPKYLELCDLICSDIKNHL